MSKTGEEKKSKKKDKEEEDVQVKQAVDEIQEEYVWDTYANL
jgi:hypothetical protein